jgi:hypothetical protein
VRATDSARRVPYVAFDAVAVRLATDAPGGAYLDLNVGLSGSGLTLDVRPAAPTRDLLHVTGIGSATGGILQTRCNAVPYAIAGVLLALRDLTGRRPRCRFPWPRHGLVGSLAVVLVGQGDVSAHVREVLRRAEPDPHRRPVVHIGD